MQHHARNIAWASVVAWCAASAPAIAQEGRYTIGAGSNVSYHVHVKTIGILNETIDSSDSEVHGEVAVPPDGQPTGWVEAKIAGFHSGIKGRDRDVGHLLGAPALPVIRYRLEQLEGFDPAHARGTANAIGVLSVNGHDRTIRVPLRYRFEKQHLVVDGETPLRFSDFGIAPPVLGIWLKRAPDLLTIRVHLEGVAAP